MHEYSTKKKMASAASVFRTYWSHTRPYVHLFLLVVVSGAALQAANLAAPLFLRQFFNTLSANSPTPEVVQSLLVTLSLVVLMWFADWLMRRIQDYANMYFQSRAMADLFGSAFSYLIGHSYNFFISNFAGSLTHRVTKFARAYEVIFDSVMIQFFPTFLFVTGAVVVLSMRNIFLGLSLAVWSILFVLFQLYMAKSRQPIREARSEADTRITGALADAISNHTTIELFSGEKHEQGIFGKVVETWRAATIRSWLADAWVWAVVGIFMLTIEAGLLFGAVALWQKGLLTIGDFILIQAYLMTTFDRLVSINRELRRFFDAYADASEMVYIMEQQHEVKDDKGARPLEVVAGTIDFTNVTFGFGSGIAVLDGFNMHIRPGEKVALVGTSGAGKSTVTRLLLRMYDIRSGDISIDGQNVREVTQESLRSAIAFVPQEPVLFHRTLMENIRYGRLGASDEEVIEAARQAHCHEFISALPHQYNTYVGERGVRLSGGERQRVAIARAILKNAPILLLDEATSSLDSESESFIQDALKKLMQGKTVIVIAHRLSTIMKMDRILVMRQGKVVAVGSHEDLLRAGGLYQKLWNIQAGGFVGDVEEDVDVFPDDFSDDKEPPRATMK
jgi:ATP-binding cassette subfamily B protein